MPLHPERAGSGAFLTRFGATFFRTPARGRARGVAGPGHGRPGSGPDGDSRRRQADRGRTHARGAGPRGACERNARRDVREGRNGGPGAYGRARGVRRSWALARPAVRWLVRPGRHGVRGGPPGGSCAARNPFARRSLAVFPAPHPRPKISRNPPFRASWPVTSRLRGVMCPPAGPRARDRPTRFRCRTRPAAPPPRRRGPRAPYVAAPRAYASGTPAPGAPTRPTRAGRRCPGAGAAPPGPRHRENGAEPP